MNTIYGNLSRFSIVLCGMNIFVIILVHKLTYTYIYKTVFCLKCTVKVRLFRSGINMGKEKKKYIAEVIEKAKRMAWQGISLYQYIELLK